VINDIAFEDAEEKLEVLKALKKLEKKFKNSDHYSAVMLCVIGTPIDDEWPDVDSQPPN